MLALTICVDAKVYMNKGFLKMKNKRKKLPLLIYRLFDSQKYPRAQSTNKIQKNVLNYLRKEKGNLICRMRGEVLDLKGLEQREEIEDN